MRVAKSIFLRIFGALVLFFFCTGAGYVYRTWECRSDQRTIYIAAPGYLEQQGVLPDKLYEVEVTRCTLPEQWGGQREPLDRFP